MRQGANTRGRALAALAAGRWRQGAGGRALVEQQGGVITLLPWHCNTALRSRADVMQLGE